MILKTLKELILPYTEDDGSMGWISPEDLRQEAIKWHKTWKESNGIGSNAVLDFIKHFFNLTEEDLNNG